MAKTWGTRIAEALTRALEKTLRQQVQRRTRPTTKQRSSRTSSKTRTTSSTGRTSPRLSTDYPGDYVGDLSIRYAPHPGDLPDPGEVVWAWVPFEEDHSQGKDRPVLLIGRDGDWLLGLPLTSKDHDRDAQQEARAGRHWVDIGSGAWDKQRRPSEARVDRVIRVDPTAVRRVGDAVDSGTFTRVAAAVRRYR